MLLPVVVSVSFPIAVIVNTITLHRIFGADGRFVSVA
jgi:hypothetical protein